MKKDFDCVEMKQAIQEQLAKQYEGMTDEEIREAINKELLSEDSPFSRAWRRQLGTQVKEEKPS
jgi:hypothetical protein